MQRLLTLSAVRPWRPKQGTGTFVMAMIILVLGFYLIYPIVLLLTMSFNVAPNVFARPAQWGLRNWTNAWAHPRLFAALGNSFMIWGFVVGISFPIAILIAWVLGRTRVPFRNSLEFMFWAAYMFPSLSSTIGWMMMFSPNGGFANSLLEALPFVEKGPFNIFSVPGIVWAKIMSDGLALKVMFLTPAFRNMDRTLEEAARVSGCSDLKTMWRITIPMMISPIVLALCLQLVKVFQGFETEQLLGARWGFYVYSTLIYRFISGTALPDYGSAMVLASITFLIIAFIIPFQRWVVQRRQYVTVSSSFKPGVVELGRWRWPVFCGIGLILLLLTAVPLVVLVMGSFMTRSGFFNTTPLWTLSHWQLVLGDPDFLRALRTTFILATSTALLSPILFSFLAYILVRTRWRGRTLLDSIIWSSAAIPGILSGLGLLLLFLDTPGLRWLYGTIWALILVVVISGKTTGTSMLKGVFVQLGKDLEEAGRVSGAGWLRTYVHIVIPTLLPTMVLIGVLNFVGAAGQTANIVLLASKETRTLSLLALELASPEVAKMEAAGIVSIIIMAMTLGIALVGRYIARRFSLEQVTHSAFMRQTLTE